MDDRWNAVYAKMLAGACLGVTEGTRLRIATEIAHRDLARAVAEEAYSLGARAVRVDFDDPRLNLIRADRSRNEWFDDGSLPLARLAGAYVEEGWSTLTLLGEEEPGLFEGADPERLARAARARSAAWKTYREAILSNRVAWCVAPVPTAAWARSILPPERLAECAARGEGPEAALAEILRPMLRLDAADPAAAWRAHVEAIDTRSRRLNDLSLRSLHFFGPGTELCIGLSPRSRWVGGSSRTPQGAFFTPNIPTEEIFATPDARKTEGRATCTRPVSVRGAKVEGAWFEFEAGRAARCGASRNAASLERYLATDPGARRLGEVALVDSSGPVAQSGLVFDNGLIDENAACHIALGAGFEEAFEGSGGMDEAAKTAAGFNESLVHIDFMIGSDVIDVTGTDENGAAIALIRDGRFVV
jgi:aminopeptidase